MKKIPLFLFFFSTVSCALAQKLQYSRQAFSSPFADAVQVVADVGGSHHVLCFTANKKPLLYVFDKGLQSFTKAELDVKLKENCDVRTVLFGDYYLLYLHVPGSTLHQLFKVQSDGEAQDVSAIFLTGADTAWNRSTATFQLFNQSGHLVLVTHTYYEAIKKIGSRIVTFDSSLAPSLETRAFFSFDKKADNLQQIVLAGNNLLVLKTARNPESGNTLEALKVDLISGKTLISSFNSGQHLYINSTMYFSAVDSTLLIFSLMREPMNAARFQRSVFVAQLDYQLQDKMPSALVKSEFRGNTAASFLLVNCSQPRWLSTLNTVRIRKTGSPILKLPALYADESVALNIADVQSYSYEPRIEYNTPTAVHFIVLNEGFKPVEDSVVANKGNFYDVQPRPYAQFTIGRKAYLLLLQNFSVKQRGLLLLTNDETGSLSSISLPVFDRYEYMIPQVQTAKNYFILPYTYKNEIGLVKITPTD